MGVFRLDCEAINPVVDRSSTAGRHRVERSPGCQNPLLRRACFLRASAIGFRAS